jgi:phosphate transport system substrate-binding protein
LWAACGVAAAAGSAPAPAWLGDMISARAFMADTAKVYNLKRKQSVQVKAINTVAAIEAVARGSLDVVGSARPAAERVALEQNLEFTPVAWDALAVLTHPSNPVKNLSLTQLRDIFAGRIKNWSQLGGPAKAINVYAVAGPLDGAEFSLRRVLFGNGAIGVAAGRWYINTQQLEDAIAIDPVAIGVSTLSNVHGNKGVRPFAIEGVTPSNATLASGEYLLPIPLYIVSRRESPGQTSSVPLARRVLEFIRDEPAISEIMRRKQLVPIADAVRLSQTQASRDAFIIQHLGARALAMTSVKPPPPPPTKPKLTNPLRARDVETLQARAPIAAAVKPSTKINSIAPPPGEASFKTRCRPQPVCG